MHQYWNLVYNKDVTSGQQEMKDFPTDSTGIDFLKIELNSYLHFFLKNEVNLDETMWEMWGKKIKALEVLKETMDEFSSFGIAQSFLRQH